MNEKTYFGFKKIDKNLKKSLVSNVFSSVAGKYDLMNNVMSFGAHHLWKKFLIEKMPNKRGALIDVAGGTGDVAKLYSQASRAKSYIPMITICDINIDMLNVGRDKLINNNILDINYICGNAEDLPVMSNIYEYYTIVFGIRNVTNMQSALYEAYRVLKPGGKFLCMEFSKVDNEIISKLYDFYSFNIIPNIGKIIANDKESYQYLVESIRKFPSQEQFLSMIEKAGFRRVKYINLSLGITTLWYGYKI